MGRRVEGRGRSAHFPVIVAVSTWRENRESGQLLFPAISCGVFGFPIDQAAQIAVATIAWELKGNPLPEIVGLVCFNDIVFEAYQLATESL